MGYLKLRAFPQREVKVGPDHSNLENSLAVTTEIKLIVDTGRSREINKRFITYHRKQRLSHRNKHFLLIQCLL